MLVRTVAHRGKGLQETQAWVYPLQSGALNIFFNFFYSHFPTGNKHPRGMYTVSRTSTEQLNDYFAPIYMLNHLHISTETAWQKPSCLNKDQLSMGSFYN